MCLCAVLLLICEISTKKKLLDYDAVLRLLCLSVCVCVCGVHVCLFEHVVEISLYLLKIDVL